jgi:cyanophycinase
VKGDTGTIIGRSKAFVYNGNDKTDQGKPFLTLFPGDRYNLATRRVLHRAASESAVTPAFVDSLFAKYANPAVGGAAVLVAQNGKVFIARSYGIPAQPKYMPTTTVPQFALGEIGEVFSVICPQMPEAPAGRGANTNPDSTTGRGGRAGRAGGPPSTPLQSCVRRVGGSVGMAKTNATEAGVVQSNVDELYRLALGLEYPRAFTRDTTGTANFDATRGWRSDLYRGVTRMSLFGTTDGKRHAFVRIPERRATIIILTNDDAADAKAMADRISDRLLR